MIDEEIAKTLYNKKPINFKDLQAVPQQVRPTVTQSDAIKGFIERYFVRQVNDTAFIVEVDKRQYEEFKDNPRFITTSIKWRIVGKKENLTFNGKIVPGVEENNRRDVENVDLTFGHLRKYITTYLEYWVAEEV